VNFDESADEILKRMQVIVDRCELDRLGGFLDET
jgi:hypothetical protein